MDVSDSVPAPRARASGATSSQLPCLGHLQSQASLALACRGTGAELAGVYGAWAWVSGLCLAFIFNQEDFPSVFLQIRACW